MLNAARWNYRFGLILLVLTAISAAPVLAEITVTGDVDPNDPNDWNMFNRGTIGYQSSGTLNITNGDAVSSDGAYLGFQAGSTGVVTVDGAGSTWVNHDYLRVGIEGNGRLNIINGGSVDVLGSTWLAYWSGSEGTIHFDVGTLTTGSLRAGASQLMGVGTIHTRSLASDVDQVFGSAADFSQTFVLNSQPGQNITVHLDMDGQGDLGAGYTGTGSLAVSNGIGVTSEFGYLGYHSGSTGVASVDGPGSAWTNSKELLVGRWGNGTLNVTNGGMVSGAGYIGERAGSTGVVTVDGAGSTWTTNDGFLNVGQGGSGTLNITNGGRVSDTRYGYIGDDVGSTGEVTVDGVGSMWTINERLRVGLRGNGRLNIINGGSVDVLGSTSVAHGSGSEGTIHFDAGTLTTGSLRAGESQLTGVGTIHTRSLVGDVDQVFDGAEDFSQTFMLNNQPGQNITIHLDMDGQGDLGAGYTGTGSLAISNGIGVASEEGYLGYHSGSTGVATVDGNGSTWTNSSRVYVGRGGNGTLNITNGGTVGSTRGYIGSEAGSVGEVTVDGDDSEWVIDEPLPGPWAMEPPESTWVPNGDLRVGHYGRGTLSITNGGAVRNYFGHIAIESGSTGEVTVDGPGSTWTNTGHLNVGHYGSGMLNIANAGEVVVEGTTSVAIRSGTGSSIHFEGGTLTTESLRAGASQLTGVGVINTRGLVGDVDLVFDSAGDLNQTVLLNSQPGQDITINVNPDNPRDLGAGYIGSGSLTISNGVEINSTEGYLGYHPGSIGHATVDGSSSTWTTIYHTYVGYWGEGKLNVTHGGTVSSKRCFIGDKANSSGEVMVDGAGSTLTNSSYFTVGNNGSGTLNISNGGAVSDTVGFIGREPGSTGAVTVDGASSKWTNSSSLYVGRDGSGTLTIRNGGLVSVAGALIIDYLADGNSFINMTNDGMLALMGQAGESLPAFLELAEGTDDIRYWDESSLSGWAHISGATYGEDYTLEYMTAGNLTGFTVLTVTAVPEPATLAMLAFGAVALMRRRKK